MRVPGRDLLRVRDDPHQVLPGKILEADLAGAADVQRDRAERRRVLLVDGGRGRGAEGREHSNRAGGAGRTSRSRSVLANRDVDGVPFTGLQGGAWASAAADLRTACGRRGLCCRRWSIGAAPTTTAAAARTRGIRCRRTPTGGVGRRRCAGAATTPGCGQPVSRRFLAARIERHRVVPRVTVSERHEHAGHAAVGGLLRSQQHARRALAGALVIQIQLHVLEALVQNEPAPAGAGLGLADDLAVLRGPAGVADNVPARERGAREGSVRLEVRWIGSTDAEDETDGARGGDRNGTNESVMVGHGALHFTSARRQDARPTDVPAAAVRTAYATRGFRTSP